MKHAASLLYSFILFLGDFVALTAAFTLAYIIRVKLDDRPLLEPITALGYIGVVAVLLVFWLIIYSLLGLYRTHVYENRFKEFVMLAIGSFIGIQFLISAEYVLNRAIFPARLVTVYGFLFAFLLTLLFRTIARAVRRTFFYFGIGVANVLLVGSTEISYELYKTLTQPHLGYRVIGVIGDREILKQIPEDMHFGSFRQAVEKLSHHHIQGIVQTELYSNQNKNDEILAYAQEHHISYRFVPGNSRMFVGNIEVNLFEGVPTIAVHQTALTGWGRIAKRVFDVLFGSLLLILSAPVLCTIWLILQAFGGGNPVYRQTRMSRFNNQIRLFKFRTHKAIYNGLSPEEAFTKMGKPELAVAYRKNGDFIDDDPRISTIGKFLRKTSLDELPQLLNVVMGDLSLVGPRPLVPEEMRQFAKKSVILSVKPGLTGLAVISGRRNINFEERRKIDMYYVQNWSFFLDIVILLRTIVMVLRQVGAK